MHEPRPIRVAILVQDHFKARRWTTALQGQPFEVWRPGDALHPSTQFDVIVTDRAGDPFGENEASGEFWETYAKDTGIIRVDALGPADLRLEADATDRELRLACRLLALVADLRRKNRAQTTIQGQLLHQALTDPLTGLPNRRAWDQALRDRLQSQAAAGAAICLAIVDLDHFKQANDQFGHIVGDRILQAAGKALASGLRTGDLVCRLGGDEFGLLLTMPDLDTARQVIQRVRNRIPHCLAQAALPPITASAGLTVATPPVMAAPWTPDTLVAQADAALQHAKRAGRDRIAVA